MTEEPNTMADTPSPRLAGSWGRWAHLQRGNRLATITRHARIDGTPLVFVVEFQGQAMASATTWREAMALAAAFVNDHVETREQFRHEHNAMSKHANGFDM